MLAGIIDSKMVSAVGVTAISAVSVTTQPKLFVFSVFLALNTVITSLTARYMGEKDRDGANRLFDSALKIIVLLSILFSLACVVLAYPIMLACSHQMDTLSASVTYFRIVMGGMIFNTVFMGVNAALRGCGRTGLTFASNALSCAVNIFLNYLLIEGHLGFPALGITGAAIATVAGTAAAFILVLCFVFRQDVFISIPYCLKKRYRLSAEGTRELREMSRSTITDGLAMRTSLLVISGIVARIGSYQMSVYALGMHLLGINQSLGVGLQTAAVALIGRCHGAKDTALLNIYKNHIVKTGIISAVVLGAAIAAGGRWFYGFFSDDPGFISMGAVSCLFIGAITLAQTLKFVYSGCLQGVGAMKEVMTASIFGFSLVNLGVLVLTVFILKTGIWGAWIGSLTAQSCQAFMLWRYTKKLDSFKEI